MADTIENRDGRAPLSATVPMDARGFEDCDQPFCSLPGAASRQRRAVFVSDREHGRVACARQANAKRGRTE